MLVSWVLDVAKAGQAMVLRKGSFFAAGSLKPEPMTFQLGCLCSTSLADERSQCRGSGNNSRCQPWSATVAK